MTTQAPPSNLLPLNPEQLARLQAATTDFTPTQLAWVSGYFWGVLNQQSGAAVAAPAPAAEVPTITLISASQTGNARRVAEALRDDLLAAKLNVKLVNAGDYKFKQIAAEKLLVVVTSTQGEGEPPEEAVALHKFLFSKKAPKLDGTAFAVFGLGDTSYEFFCQSGKDFDNKLAELGAERLLDRVDADVEYQAAAAEWRARVVEALKARAPVAAPAQLATSGAVNDIHTSPYTKEAPLTATLSVNQKITGRNSEKDVRHIEIDLGDSGLRYQPGDALGVWYQNDPQLVKELVELLWLKGDEPVTVEGKTLPLSEALQWHFELTVNTATIVENYATLTRSESLLPLVGDKAQLQQYAAATPIVDMVRFSPAQLDAEALIGLLRPLTPRLYSIASSQAEVESEVHVTVGVVRYEIEGRARAGGASSFLADRVEEDGEVRVFIEHNDNFRLPANPETPVIMIGPGTGIAPFRAFMQQRAADGAQGKNWLFFGNPHFTEDFLYQVEWQSYVKEGLLTRIDLAWSRDQQQKIYVQDKLREQGAELWRWINDGAHIYVCGDANRMAKDVENTLLEVIAEYGAMDAEAADEFLSELRVERRYQRDVYLRGTIAEDLNDGLTGGFKGDNFLLIRFHGMYQQDDRDIRAERAAQKLEPRHAMLLRCRLPGGVITTTQWKAIDKFAAENTIYGSIRLTNRQTFQFHGILKKNVKPVHQMLHSVGLDALATANDMNRNVLCTSNPYESQLHAEAYEWAKKISEHLLPRTRAYAEIWLDQKKVATTDEEPILGQTYLPRKFKTTVVIPPQNDIDLHANDMNFVAIAENGKLVGFNLLVGGGLSIEHGNKKTYARTASEFGYLPLEHTLAVAEAVVTTQRDWGNRTDRKNAKTKYTLERVGVETFKAEVERRAGIKFEPIRPYEFTGRGDRIGWVKGIDDKWHLTLFIENGRILDYPGRPLKTGLLEIAKVHQGEFRITANQNLIVASVPEDQKARIEKLARDHGLMNAVTPQRENSMACVSFPTCPLAMAEAERFLPSFIDKVEGVMSKHGVSDEHIVTRVTGCPNGCGRAMLAEVGLVGKAPGRYNLHIGGNRNGTRIPRMYRENITESEILDSLDELVGRWAKEREAGEGFGDFTVRAGIIRPVLDPARDFWE
ncbi:MAG: NADPH-dependent assimilatory sulfite reductase flavoprotein subunit [Klebsiella pneumoniae]|nr:NADPH-dependent assimilatory sulfite reductase flavoprotein subunit [Klebsiella pneumoniae]